jgi:hypothetical protein
MAREDSTPSILDMVTVQSATRWPVSFPLRRSIVEILMAAATELEKPSQMAAA